jgi:hypothetical protein
MQKVTSAAVVSSAGRQHYYPLSRVESLEISSELLKWQLHQEQEHTEEDARWLNVLQPFFAVKNLYPRENATKSRVRTERGIEEQVTQVLPALQGTFHG